MQKVLSKFDEFCMCLVCVMMNWKETLPLDCEVWSVVCFLTIENNSRAEICCFCSAYREENVMNLRNVLRCQSMFYEKRTYTMTRAMGD